MLLKRVKTEWSCTFAQELKSNSERGGKKKSDYAGFC